MAHHLPHLMQLNANECTESRVSVGAGVEVAGRSDVVGSGIVAAARPKQGQAHEFRKSYRAACQNPAADFLLDRHAAMVYPGPAIKKRAATALFS
jgi:hypothetical protein